MFEMMHAFIGFLLLNVHYAILSINSNLIHMSKFCLNAFTYAFRCIFKLQIGLYSAHYIDLEILCFADDRMNAEEGVILYLNDGNFANSCYN